MVRKDLDWSPSAPANKLLKLETWQVVFAGWLRLGSEDAGSHGAQGDAKLGTCVEPLRFPTLTIIYAKHAAQGEKNSVRAAGAQTGWSGLV